MGFLQDLLGGGGGDVSGLQNKQSRLIERSNRLADMLMASYDQNLRSGAYDPNAQLDLLRRDTEYGTGLATGNAAAAARTMGYRPGDSEPILRTKAISDRATLDYDRLANEIRTNATANQTAALSNAVGGASSIYGRGVDAYGGQIQTALQRQQQGQGLFGALLDSAMPFLGGLGRSSSPASPMPSYYGGARAGNFLRR